MRASTSNYICIIEAAGFNQLPVPCPLLLLSCSPFLPLLLCFKVLLSHHQFFFPVLFQPRQTSMFASHFSYFMCLTAFTFLLIHTVLTCLSVPVFEWQLWKWLLVLNTTSACVKGMTHLSASGALRYFWLFSFTFSCPSPFFHSLFFLNNLSRGKLFVIHKALFSPAEQTNLGQQAILTQLHFFYFSCANDLNIFPFS